MTDDAEARSAELTPGWESGVSSIKRQDEDRDLSDATHNAGIGNGFSATVALPNHFSRREVPVQLHGTWTDRGIRLHLSGLDLRNFEAVVGPQQAQEYRDFVATRRAQPMTLPRFAKRARRRLARR